MQEEFQIKSEPYDDDVLDLGQLFKDYVRCLKKYWKYFIILIILTTAAVMGYEHWSYKPVYTSKITYAVNKMEDTNVNIFVAKSLSTSVSTVTSAADFREDLMEELGQQETGVGYTISSAYTEGTNLFSISVSSGDYISANNVMQALKDVYPVWASKANGTVELQVVDEIDAPQSPVNPYAPIKYIMTGMIVGIGICFVIATGYALTVKTIRSESDMRRITGKSCISSIPDVRIKKRNESTKEQLLINKKRIDWGFKQSILGAQSRIEKQMMSNLSKVLLVTSTLPQEGKSMTAVNMALAFAKREKKVLIIDGDLRNPSVGKVLGVEESKKGLVDFFEGGAVLKDIIFSKEGIDVIGSGTKKGDVSRNVPEIRMQDLMLWLRDQYDYIIIDTPPTHLFTDAELLEKYVDSVLYIVRYDMAEMNEVKDGITPFIRSGKLLGYVINRSPGGYSTYGKYGYSKYGHYGKYKKYIDLDESSLNTEDTL